MNVAPQEIPIIGRPLAFAVGFLALTLVAFAPQYGLVVPRLADWLARIGTATLTGHAARGFSFKDDQGRGFGGVEYDGGFSAGDIVIRVVGFSTPPLAGLGGAHLVAEGNSWAVLWVGLVLLVVAVGQAIGALSIVVTTVAVLAVGWVALQGGPRLQAAVAVGFVWLLLVGGLYKATTISYAPDGSLDKLARRTLVPRLVWQAGFVALAVVALWVGGRVLLGY